MSYVEAFVTGECIKMFLVRDEGLKKASFLKIHLDSLK